MYLARTYALDTNPQAHYASSAIIGTPLCGPLRATSVVLVSWWLYSHVKLVNCFNV